KISGIGKAGNPLVQDKVDIIIGSATEVISGEGKIVTAGAIDTHVHFINPDQVDVALTNGTTTLIGGGAGPGAGSRATTATPGKWHMHTMLKALEGLPINIGLTGNGHVDNKGPLAIQILAGTIGLNIHEVCGATSSIIYHALNVVDNYYVQIALHADTLS